MFLQQVAGVQGALVEVAPVVTKDLCLCLSHRWQSAKTDGYHEGNLSSQVRDERFFLGGSGGGYKVKADKSNGTILGPTQRTLSETGETASSLKPYKLVSRETQPEPTIIRMGEVEIGGDELVVMAGPCAVESEKQLFAAAQVCAAAGAKILRGGAFKPRSSPYSFQGLGVYGLELLRAAGRSTGMLVVTEVIRPEDVELVGLYADIYQVGARNMHNFPLLQELGRARKPVLLKRGLAATIEEWLMAGEYILAEGNQQVILCERGIRTFETATRNTLDLSAIPVIQAKSHLPIIVDPSHGTGHRQLVAPMAKAAVAAGAAGLMIEVHPDPERAVSDGEQSLSPEQFAALMDELRKLAAVCGKRL